MEVSPDLPQARSTRGKVERWIVRVSLALSPLIVFAMIKWGVINDCFSNARGAAAHVKGSGESGRPGPKAFGGV
jgi:hypothetical protein